MEIEEDVQPYQTLAAYAVIDKEDGLKKGLEYMKSICMVPTSTVDKIITHNEFLDHLERDNNIIANDAELKDLSYYCLSRPFWISNKDYKGSSKYVLVERETKEI
jgi:hypothetical protein